MATDDEQQQSPGLSLMPPLPAHEEHSTTESGVSAPVAAPEFKAAIANQAATADQQVATMGLKGQNDAAQAQAVAGAAQGALAAQDAGTAAKAKIMAEQDANVMRQADLLKQANDEIKKTPSPALFHSGDTWRNVVKAIGMAGASFGDALTARSTALSGHDVRTHSVQSIIDMAVEADKEKINKLKDNQLMAMAGLKDAKEARDFLLAREDMKAAEAMKRAQLYGDVLVKAAGPQAALYQSRLDALNLKQQANDKQVTALQSLNKTVTSRKTNESIDRDQAAPKPGSLPSSYHDPLSGQNLPIDPSLTDSRQHNTAVKDLPKVADAIQTLDKTLADVQANGAASPSVLNYIPGRKADTKQAVRGTDMQLVRSQYATAMGESMSAENSKKYEAAVPDPPSSFSTEAKQREWVDRMQAVRDKIHQYYNNQLGNAGVVTKAAPAATTPTAKTATAPAAQSAAAVSHPGAGRIAVNPQTGARIQQQADGSWKSL